MIEIIRALSSPNALEVYRTILHADPEPVTTAEIEREHQLSRSTASRILVSLSRSGALIRHHHGKHSYYVVNPSKMKLLQELVP